MYVNTANWVPYIPPNTGTFGEFGWSGICQASAIIFFAYIGFDGVSTVAQEAKDPQRGMPIGMLGSLAICTVLYIFMSSVMTGLVPFKQLNDAAPVAVASKSHPQLAGCRRWVIWGALFGLTSVIITMIIPQARIWLTMSHDGLLPKFFGAVHPEVPYTAYLDADHRRGGRNLCRSPAHRHPGRAGVDRHVDRLHRGLRRRVGAALYAAGFAAAVPGQVGMVHCRPWACCSAPAWRPRSPQTWGGSAVERYRDPGLLVYGYRNSRLRKPVSPTGTRQRSRPIWQRKA